MIAAESLPLSHLYERDETAWLDAMSALAADGRLAEMDHLNLSEYLAAMAKRDRRAVESRLVVLLMHLLKWDRQPDRHGGSWRRSIMEQRRKLRRLLDSGTLHNHAVAILADCFADARKQAAAETELPVASFPAACPWDIEALLTDSEVA